jgi:hypothetical protein
MGLRIARALGEDPDYELFSIEEFADARARLEELGRAVQEPKDALPRADVAVLAVADNAIGEVAERVVPLLPSGALVVCLDPAAPLAGKLPERADIAYFVTHPTHPPLYELLAEEDVAIRRDYWGLQGARQSIVSALVSGPEAAFARGEQLARRIFHPVLRSHRVTLEQLALLEPAMAETVTMTCVYALREALDEVIARGVPEQAARDFMLGHLQILIAFAFGELDSSSVSQAAWQILAEAREVIFRPDWKRVFERDELLASVTRIAEAR